MSACDHEDSAHHHVDVAARVADSERQSLAFAGATLGLAFLALAAALLAGRAGWQAAPLAALGWVLATAAGSGTLLRVTRSRGAGQALVGAAVVVALATVATALWIASAGGSALWAASGWATAAAVSQLGQAALWRRTLHEPGNAGESARDQAVHATPRRWAPLLAWWALPAVAFGAWVWALGLLAWTLFVVAPAAVAVQLVLARRNLAGAR